MIVTFWLYTNLFKLDWYILKNILFKYKKTNLLNFKVGFSVAMTYFTCAIFGSRVLDFCVRDGNRYFHSDIITTQLWSTSEN